jgi:hypothetical protein
MRVLLKDIRLYLNQFRLTGGRVVGALVGALVVGLFVGLSNGDKV